MPSLSGAALPGQSRHHHHAEQHDRERHEVTAARPLPQDSPSECHDEQDLQIAEHYGHPGPDICDRVDPEDQIGCPEQAGQRRVETTRKRTFPQAALFGHRKHGKERQRKREAVKGRRRRRDLRERDQDR